MSNVLLFDHWPKTREGRETLVFCIRSSVRQGTPMLFPDGSPIGEAAWDDEDIFSASIAEAG